MKKLSDEIISNTVEKSCRVVLAFEKALLENLKAVDDSAESFYCFTVGGAIAKALEDIEQELQGRGMTDSFIAGFTGYREYLSTNRDTPAMEFNKAVLKSFDNILSRN